MDDFVERLKRLEKRIPTIAFYQAAYVGRVNGRPTVDVLESRIPVEMWCPEPQVNDVVHVLNLNGQYCMTGMVVQPPTEGTVGPVTPGSPDVLVSTDQGDFRVPYYSSYTPATGNVVQLGYSRHGLRIEGVLSAEPEAPIAPPAPVATVVPQPTLILATDSGSAPKGTANWQSNDVNASATRIGIFTYGSTVKDTFAAHGVPRELHINLGAVKRNDYGNMRLGWHARTSVSGVTPAIENLRVVGTGWVNITDLAPRLAEGGGIGFDGAGFTIFTGIPKNGRPGDTQAGALRLTY